MTDGANDKPLKRAEKRARTRLRLLESAAEVFAKNGYERASVDDIAEHAGYSKGAVYSNFESKEKLFLALYDVVSEEAFRSVGGVDEENAVDAIVEEGMQLFRGLIEPESGWPLLLLEFWTYAARHPRLREKVAARSEQRRERMAQVWEKDSRERNVDLPVSPRELATFGMALANGLAVQKILYPEQVDDAYVASVFNVFTTGLLSGGRDQSA